MKSQKRDERKKLNLRERRFDHKRGRLVPRRQYPKPFRFVGIGVIIMAVLVFIFYKLMVK